MDIYYVLSVIVFVVYLQFGVFIILKNPPSDVSQWLLVLSLFLSLFTLVVIFLEMAVAVAGPLLLPPLSLLLWTVMPFFLLRVHMKYIRFPVNKTHRLWIYLLAGFSGFSLLFYHIVYAYEVMQLQQDPGSAYPIPPILFIMQMIYIFLVSAAIFFMIALTGKRIKRERSVASVRVFSFALAVFLLLAVFLDILPFYKGADADKVYTHLFAVIWLAAFSYAVVGKRLFFFTPGSVSQLVLKQVRQVMIFCDPAGAIIESNDFIVRLLQTSRKRLSTQRFIDYCFVDKQIISQAFAEALERGSSGPMIVRLQSFGGKLIDVRLSFNRISDAYDDLLGVMLSGNDMTLEQNIKHDIRLCAASVSQIKIKNKALEQRLLSCTYEKDKMDQKYIAASARRFDTENTIKTGIFVKEVLISEIYSRVKGNMNMISSLIQLYVKEGGSSATESRLHMLLQRIESILFLHESLYISLSHPEIDFKKFLDLLENKFQQEQAERFQIKKNIDCEYIDMDQAIPLGLVANELMMNALLHAFPPSHCLKLLPQLPLIQIDYYEADKNGFLSVRDNGIGLPADLNIKDSSTHGLSLADMLIREQLDGTMVISRVEGGTQIMIRYPLP